MGWGYTLFVITIIGGLVYFTVPTDDDNSVCYNEYASVYCFKTIDVNIS